MRCPTLRELPPPPPGKTGWPWTEESPQLPDTMPDGRQWPRISIVTPNYNYGQFLEETIRSVLLQGYPDLEYIIIDGGSTDNSVEIIKKYEPWLAYWVSEADMGQSHAINKGATLSRGEILNWLNSDDILLVHALRMVGLAYGDARSTCAVVVGGGIRISADTGTVLGESEVKPTTGWWIHIAPPVSGGLQPSWFISRECWNAVGGLDESLTYAMDIDLYLRLSQHTQIFIPVFAHLAASRVHNLNKTGRDRVKAIWEKRDVYLKHARVSPTAEYRWLRAMINRHSAGALLYAFQNSRDLRIIAQALYLYPPIVRRRSFWNALLAIAFQHVKLSNELSLLSGLRKREKS